MSASSYESSTQDDTSAEPSDVARDPVGNAPPKLAFPIVGIGASAGGLEALELLVRELSPYGMAFVIVQHLAPGHPKILRDILARNAALRVVTIDRATTVEAGTIYVAPPTIELSLEGASVRLTGSDSPRSNPHTIDAFLRSLAAIGGPMAVGVILSGAGSDGTLGLKAIKNEGGLTFAQEPATAGQPSMPQSAVDAGCADFVLTPTEIGEELLRLGAHPYVGRSKPPEVLGAGATTRIFAQLRAAYGVDFQQYKPNTIERRIGRRMALHRIEKVDDYLSVLASDAGELRSLYNDLLIGVTTFFRDSEPFEVLKTVLLPRIIESRGTASPIRMWVAGCATGEEAYSLAIVLLEYLGERAGAYKIQIFATDIDEDALVRARAAVYPFNIELDVSPERLHRFFLRTDKGYQVSRQVRELVVFARHNIGKDPPFSRLDLVTCRNVLIYMQAALQRSILRVFHYALHSDAYLLLGTSESVGDAADLFSLVDRKVKVYAKKDTPVSTVFDFALSDRAGDADDAGPPSAERRPIVSVAQIADRKIIEKYSPPGVIVDERLEVIQFRGRTGHCLEPTPGVATLNLLKLARPELLASLRTIVQKALVDGVPASSPAVLLRHEGGARAVGLDVMPLIDAAGRKCLLVLFHETPAPPGPAATDGARASTNPDDARFLQLESELATHKEFLQSTIEELEAANEELQSSNEELQSSNEELQSTNEELETSKEELQSTNEELATVNDELHSRMGQLSVADDDLQNVFLNTGTAVVIVGADLRIRRFSSKAEELLSLISGDVGRPIGYLRNVMGVRDIEQFAAEAIASVAVREQRVRGIDGSWYRMRVFPYVTADQMIRGLVLEFIKTVAPSEVADGEEIPELAQRLLSAVPTPLLLLDSRLKVVWANRAFFETFSIGPVALGRPLAEVWAGEKERSELWAFLDDLRAGRPTRDMLLEQAFGRTGPMRFSGGTLRDDADQPTLAVVLMLDIAPPASA